MRRRAERPTAFEVQQCILLGSFRREECPHPDLFKRLSEKIGAWEREQERRKDPIGSLCKRLNEEGSGVRFIGRERMGLDPIVRLSFQREMTQRYEPDPVPVELADFRAADMVARIVVDPAVNLAEDVEISFRMLTDDEWDYEDEICAELRGHAERLIPGGR